MSSIVDLLAPPPLPPDPDLQSLEAASKTHFETLLASPPGSVPLRQAAHLVHNMAQSTDDGITANVEQLLQQVEDADVALPGMCHLAKLVLANHHSVPSAQRNLRAVGLLRRCVAKNDCHFARWSLAEFLCDDVMYSTIRTRLYEQAWDEGGIAAAGLKLADMVLEQGGMDGAGKRVRIYEEIVQWKGCLYTMNLLGDLYLKGGFGVEMDRCKAEALYNRAVQKGCPRAMRVLGGLMMEGMGGGEVDVSKGLELMRMAGRCGDVEALLLLAELYRSGEGVVTRDMKTAMWFYERGVEKGCLRSAMRLGDLFYYGSEGIDVDLGRALELFNMTEKDEGLFRKVRSDVAFLVVEQREGVDQDTKRAVRIYEQILAEEGNQAPIMFNLAGVLLRGEGGTERDVDRAVSLYKAAIQEFGHVESMTQLGILWSGNTEGIKANKEAAAALLEEAVVRGEKEAKYFLSSLYAGIDGEPTFITRRLRLLEEVIDDLGHLQAIHDLSVIVAGGMHGVKQDFQRAADLCERGIAVAFENEEEVLRELEVDIKPKWRVSENSDASSVRKLCIKKGLHFALMEELAGFLMSGLIPRNVSKALRLLERVLTRPDEDEYGSGESLFELLYITECMMKGFNDYEGNVKAGLRVRQLVIGAPQCNQVSRGYALRLQARFLLEGAEGVTCDKKRALMLYKESVEAGDREAAIALGHLMRSGIEECPMDEVGAFDLYARALQGEYCEDVSQEAAVEMALVFEGRKKRKLQNLETVEMTD